MCKTVLITGGSKGIGFVSAEKLLKDGKNVIITGRHEKQLEEAVRKLSGHVKYKVWDVGDIENVKTYFAEAVKLFGKIDVVINNAGILSDSDLANDFFSVTPEQWDRVEIVNLKGLFFICQCAASFMIQNGIKGHIVNVCSEMGFRPVWYPYGISKWGVRGLTYGLGHLLASHGIVVNGVAPGHTATDLVKWNENESLELDSIPRGCMATPEEIAELICFLASDAANNIMGEIVISDGARHLY